MKLKDNIGKFINDQKQKGGAIPLLGVSLILFVMTVAVYFTANYVSEGIARGNALTGWEYLYTERAGAVPDADLRVYNLQNPIVTDRDVRRENAYFTKTLAPAEENRTLVIRTDHAPVKIRINGRDVYHNQFDDAQYVGNCYNAVTIEASSRDRVVEVFLRLPFSVRFEAELISGSAVSFCPTAGFWMGAALTLAFFAALCVMVIRSVGRSHRRRRRSVSVAAAGFYCGAAVTLYNLPEVTYLFNLPIWMNIITAAVHMTLMAALLGIIIWLPHRRKLLVSAFFAIGISVLTVMLAPDPLLIMITGGVMSLLTAMAVLYTAGNLLPLVQRRTRFATAVFVFSIYLFMMSVLAGVQLLTRSLNLYIYNVAMPTLVIVAALGYIYYSGFRFARKNAEVLQQTVRYGNSVDSISRFIRNMLACHEKEQFYECAVEEITELVTRYNSENAALRCGVAVRSGEGFHELLNRGLDDCRYEMIAANSQSHGKACLFSDTYFDYLLSDDEGTRAIFHFENLTGCLDLFFVSMIEAAYCGLETAYDAVCGGHRRSIEAVFTELAENAEISDGYSAAHLEHVSDYTRRLCLQIGMSESEAEMTSLASKLHDLGKIAIPSGIINKEGKLTEEERAIVSNHTEFGYVILSAYGDDPLLQQAAEIARYHHEQWDGSGKNGLSEEKIPLCARIVTVCDVYDALVSERAYKKPWSRSRSLAYLSDNAGIIFDPKLVEAFETVIKKSK